MYELFVTKLCYNKFSSISLKCLFLLQTLEVDIQSRQVDVDKLTKTGKRRPSSEAQNYGSLRRQKRAVSGRYLQYASLPVCLTQLLFNSFKRCVF